MANRTLTDYRNLGDAYIERLNGIDLPASLRPHVKTFTTAHRAYATAADKVDRAQEARDEKIEDIGTADGTLDPSLLALADELVGAKMGRRQNPFAAFSRYAPSKLVALAYKTEIDETRKLCRAITKAKPTAAVKAAASACLRDADALEKALAALTAPETAYQKAIAARDATLLDWKKAEIRLKRNAAAAWVDEPATYRTLFAPPPRVQEGGKRGARKPRKPAPAKPPKKEPDGG